MFENQFYKNRNALTGMAIIVTEFFTPVFRPELDSPDVEEKNEYINLYFTEADSVYNIRSRAYTIEHTQSVLVTSFG